MRQAEIIEFLSFPKAHDGKPVKRIDTHAASVFLSGQRALKLKRAVRYPYLDYSTIEKRRAACEEELRLNRSFAPQIYLGVLPIVRSRDGTFSIGGSGTPVDWLLEMRRFDEQQTLDHVAQRSPLTFELGVLVADAIAACHDLAPRARDTRWIDSIPKIISANTQALSSRGWFREEEIRDLDRQSSFKLAQIRPLLEQRHDLGLVRRCHGDLHLANIVMIDVKPVLFDALEFDPVMATIDVLYDLAFVVMDLIHHGSDDAASAVLNRYVAVTTSDNLDGLVALPLFLSMRAAIRANVLTQRGADLQPLSQSYFGLARHLIAAQTPTVVAIGGLSGTGKSLLARALSRFIAPLPGAIVLRSDILRKQLFNIVETERLPASAYQPDVTQRTYDTLAASAKRVLTAGHSVIVDGVFSRAAERDLIRDVARSSNVRFIGLFLQTDLDTRIKRIDARSKDASDATADVARKQAAYDLGVLDWHVVDASGPPEQTLARSRALLLP